MADKYAVMKAKKGYRSGALGSLSSTQYMLIKQYNFPEYIVEDVDRHFSADHDRMLGWEYDGFRACLKKHIGTGELGLENYFNNCFPEKALEFLTELFRLFVEDKAEYNTIKFTGWRAIGSVNRSNGYPVYSLELVANNSGQKVYSGSNGVPQMEEPDYKEFYSSFGPGFNIGDYDLIVAKIKKKKS